MPAQKVIRLAGERGEAKSDNLISISTRKVLIEMPSRHEAKAMKTNEMYTSTHESKIRNALPTKEAKAKNNNLAQA